MPLLPSPHQQQYLSAPVQYLSREQVLLVGTMLGVHTTILEVALGVMRANKSTLPAQPMNATALVYFGHFMSPYKATLEANHFFPVWLGSRPTPKARVVPKMFVP